MKRLSLILLVCLILPNVIAISVDLKEEYQPMETVITKITGNFIEPLTDNNIMFYSDRLLVPMDYSVGKFGDYYYLYAVLPNKIRNYTLKLKDIHYFELGEDKKSTLEFNFSVSGMVANFTVNPGIIITSKDFNLDLSSNVDPITLKLDYLDFSTEIQVPAGRTKSILVPLQFSEEDINFVEITSESVPDLSYKVPVNAIVKGIVPKSLEFSKTLYNLSMFKGSNNQITLYLQNPGQQDVEDIVITSNSDDIVIIPNNLSSIKSTKFAEINLTIVPEEDTDFVVYADSEGVSANTTIKISVITIDVGTLLPQEIKKYSCSEIGESCTDSQYCDGQLVSTLETEECCIGECKGNFPTAIVLSILLIIGIGIIGYYIWKQSQKKTTKQPIQKELISRFSEVKRSLSRT